VIDDLLHRLGLLQGWIFETLIEPLLYGLGLMNYAEDVFDWMWLPLFGGVAVIAAYLICRPLELWRPVEPRTDGQAVRTDITYTLVHRLGLVPLSVFVLLAPASYYIDRALMFRGILPEAIDQTIPALADWPLLTLAIYLVILDFAEYWRHRLQHRLGWWWALHSLHHDQRQMTLWTDDRNHILDDILQSAWLGGIALLIGVEPAQFPVIIIVLRLVESLSHANVRLGFGRLGDWLLVSPHFHRVHHALDHATEAPFDRAGGCNFAVILPIWDILFGTRRRDPDFPPTGIRSADARWAGLGYLRHQLEGFRRLARALMPGGTSRPGPAAVEPGE
jgi:sterol desaturase/sphingolipid hydroxylase (fatty acid hydroxylase superfamily)